MQMVDVTFMVRGVPGKRRLKSKEEIGIGKIYYHTFNFGCRIKRIAGSKPPVSLYTKLPDRFCFKKTNQAPGFLMRRNNRKIIDLLKHHDPRFYLLAL
jgi:hypothetical protein